MEQKQIKFYSIAGCSALVLVIALVVSLKPFYRYMGQIPYLLSDSFNRTLKYYTHTNPSRQVLLIAGPFKSGKSRAINLMASEMENSGHFVLNIDAARASNIQDFFKLVQYEIATSLVNVRQYITSAELKLISDVEVPELNVTCPTPIFSDPALAKPYIAFSSILEAIYHNGTFSEWAVHQFFDLLEKYGNAIQPALFLHNIEILKAYKTDEEPFLGLKIIEAAKSRLIRRDHYKDTIPIFVEIKNSFVRIGINSDIFKIVQVDAPKNAYSTFVNKYSVFRSSEFKQIESNFGLHIGTFSKIFEDLKYNVELSAALQNLQDMISQNVNRLLTDPAAKAAGKRLCKAHGKMRMSNSTDIESLIPLFENGYLYLKKGLKVRSMNKGVTNALCSL
ncbi:hypothetical protein TRFO_24904 [Tritrichomonas foetus]|uniref:Uncharacterized protein n=1 Tax=Tritrichomonas foetus TaxID=1144522 RepID=A0A1J4K698_9EUKA|nr:hypothetical protein TRFO_24904 [Tritrichomonas foetus]|eukprot:OHT06943.1 hypothetical protein TRFO_24904 [Tritrichomonas foetus]